MTDQIKKQIDIPAPRTRVWRALTDYREFGEWFRVKLEGPFAVGETARGHILYPGYEHLIMEVEVQKIEPEHLFSYTWHPYAVDPEVDYSDEVPTLVEFRLEETTTGTRLTVTESGFDKVPAHRRLDACRMNEGGWEEQVQNILRHVSANP